MPGFQSVLFLRSLHGYSLPVQWFAMRNICDDDAHASLAKNFCTRIKFGLQLTDHIRVSTE